MEPNTQLLPEYENPPVVEVVCNLLFEPLENLLVPHVGLFWERFRTEYPECSEHDPIVPIIERFDEPPKMKIEMNEIKIASLPRVWFVQKRGNGIIQIQRDRFILNWRKVKEEDEYPRYSFVIDQFMKYLSHFKAFLDENDLGKIVPLQYEMTYVNHIPKGEGWDSLSDVGNVFPDFSWQQTRERFLPIFDGINFQTRFELPERAGRMYLTIRNAKTQNDYPILTLELKVRGIGSYNSHETLLKWFNQAHEWIVRGFTDITSSEIQTKIWRRTR